MASSFPLSDFLISLIIILCTSTITTEVKTKEKHFQVYSLLKSNFIYQTIKDRNQKTPRKTKETFWEKADICMSIIKSEWMNKVYHLNVIDLHEEDTFLEVRKDYPHIYRKSYMHYTSDSKDPVFENPYRLRNITTRNDEPGKLTSIIRDHKPEIISENIFSCLAKNRHKWQLVEYFISPEYDFKIPVRFIFEYNDVGEMIPIGIAVESTPGSENIDKYFEEFKRDDETGVFSIGSDSVSDYLSQCKKESQERRSKILKSIPKPSAILFGHS